MAKITEKEMAVDIEVTDKLHVENEKMSKNFEEDTEDKKTSYSLYGAAFTANLIALACGITFSWTSPVLLKLNGNRDAHLNPLTSPITPEQECWIANSMGLGAFLGPLAVAKLADIIGRKRTLLISALPLLVSFLVLGFATDVRYMYAARFSGGLGLGAVFVLLPVYLGEIAEDHNRGELGCIMSVFIASGVLFSFLVGPFLSIRMFCVACTVPVWAFLIFFGGFVPESPVHFVCKGDRDGASRSLAKLRNADPKSIEAELEGIVEYVEEVKSKEVILREVFRSRAVVRGLTISVGLVLFQQLSGICVVLAFMQSILDTGGDVISSEVSVIVVGSVQVLTTIVTSSVIERLGSKVLLLVSSVGAGLSLVCLGCYFYLQDAGYNVHSVFWLPMASLIAYIIFFNFGLGPLPWAILGEIFPADVKSMASMITTSIVFFAMFLMTMFFSYLAQYVGMALTFWMFAVCCAFSAVFVWFCVIETKGKSLTEIQNILGGKQ